MKKSRLVLISVLVLMLVAVSACGTTAGLSSTPTPTSTPAPIAQPTPTPVVGTPLSSLPSVADVVTAVEPAVVFVSVEYVDTSLFFQTVQTKSGSGVILSPDGYILTNNHVVDGARDIKVSLPNAESTYEAKIVGADSISDLAVIKIEGKDFPTAEFGDVSSLRIGDWVVAMGNALALEGGPSVTIGIVSSLNRSFTIDQSAYYDIIQTDAAINPGNSGGPLVNMDGQVIGIDTFIVSGAQNIGFAVSARTAQKVYDDLVQHGKVTWPYLGIVLRTVTPTLSSQLGLSKDEGVLAWQVESGGPAAKAGIEDNDVITQFDGQDVADASELTRLLWQHNVGDVVTLTLWRGDAMQEVSVTLGTRPTSS
jgi:serine protease Do